jgi:hypothetical protein
LLLNRVPKILQQLKTVSHLMGPWRALGRATGIETAAVSTYPIVYRPPDNSVANEPSIRPSDLSRHPKSHGAPGHHSGPVAGHFALAPVVDPDDVNRCRAGTMISCAAL